MILLPASPFWKKKENHPYPWVLVGLLSIVGGWVLAALGLSWALLAGPDGIAEVW